MKLKVFYNAKQATDAETSFSPSARKPKLLVERWLQEQRPIEVVSDWEPVSVEQLYKAHLQAHVDAVLACKSLNGFGNALPEIAKTLPWTTGSLLAAATYAFKNKTTAMSPTSGFHHATQKQCMGFCSFNGLMVTALELIEQGAVRVGILDLDHHYGNGTDSIIDWVTESDPEFPKRIHHYTVGGDLTYNKIVEGFVTSEGRPIYGWQGGDATQRWLTALPDIVASFKGCDIVIFQAGADPHVDDPCHEMIGCEGALTTEQFAQRDRLVFDGLKKLNVPVVWNLAGGYQNPVDKVLDIHTQTLELCLSED